MVAVFVLVLLVCCELTRRFIEAPMQRLGQWVAGRLDAGRAAATVKVEPGGFGGIESQLATDGPTAFAAVNALTFMYRPRFWDRRFCA